jgi:hypothetical protein
VLLELFHVSADQHLAQFDKVAVFLVVDLNDTPRIATTAHFTAICCGDLGVGTNNGERNFGHNLLVLGNGLLVVKLVAGSLKDLNRMVLDICKNLIGVTGLVTNS